jgi:hypothetical protein
LSDGNVGVRKLTPIYGPSTIGIDMDEVLGDKGRLRVDGLLWGCNPACLIRFARGLSCDKPKQQWLNLPHIGMTGPVVPFHLCSKEIT